MAGRYDRHERRQVQCLDGVWDFAFLGDLEVAALDVKSLSYPEMMAVPGCFDALPPRALARGLVAYRRRLVLPRAGRYRVVFHAVQHVAHVFFAGELLAEHAGGFTRFTVDLGQREAGHDDLVVVVDNRLDWARCPLHLDYFDWYHYGGIARSVELELLPQTWLRSVAVDTLSTDSPCVELRIEHESAEAGQRELRVLFDGREVLREAVDISRREPLVRTLSLPGASLWSPEQPSLHMLEVFLGEDDLRTRVGLRRIEARDRQLFLNGVPLQLRGVNRHQFHPLFGHALPDSVNLADIALLRELGANFVRGSHYPQDSGFLDLCDEAGLCVWNEAIGWQHTAEHLTDERFIKAQLAHVREMVSQSRNHPSVLIWGILNEGHSHQLECRPGYDRLLGELRLLDATRPVTYASMFGYDDACFDLCDIVSVNTYPGWYQREIPDIDAELERLLSHLEKAQPAKPVIISEIGAAAVYGCHELGAGRWTEEYQARLLTSVITKVFERERVAGLAIWQFSDTRTSDRVSVVLGKPRGYNNKGLLDELRRPKLAFAAVAALFRARASQPAV